MRKVILQMGEDRIYLAIKELVGHGGNKQRAALKSGVAVRTVNRYIISYCLVSRAFNGQIFASVR